MNNTPKIDQSAFIADGAKVIGNVTIGKNASIWYNAVLRADLPGVEIVVGEGSNIQDCTVIHQDHGKSAIIGKNVTVGHSCIIHGCTIEDNCLIGMGAIILSGAVVKKGAIIAAGAVVKENAIVEENTLYAGIPAKEIKKLDDKYSKAVQDNADEYVHLSETHKKGEFKLYSIRLKI